MKKILASILAIFYLSSAVGATIHLHYCMDKFINWSLTNSDGDKCDKCEMEKDGGCCKDEDKFVKNNIDQKLGDSGISLIRVAAVATPATFIYSSEDYFSSLIKEYPTNHPPPPNTGVSIHILNRVFRL